MEFSRLLSDRWSVIRFFKANKMDEELKDGISEVNKEDDKVINIRL